MRRLLNAIREWRQLRARLRDERRFHLDCAAAELRDCRYGRQSLGAAARELGCDFAGLVDSIRTQRVLAFPWLQPAALFSLIALVFLLSPQPRELANSVFVRAHRAGTPSAILTVDIGSRWFGGDITGQDFAALQSMTTLTRVERYRGSYAWGQSAPGATLAAIYRKLAAKQAIQSLWRNSWRRTGNSSPTLLKACGLSSDVAAQFFCCEHPRASGGGCYTDSL